MTNSATETRPAHDKRIIAVIPAHNEQESLPVTLKELAAVRPDVDVVIVDDGSTDQTARIARSIGCPTVSLPVNLGIGGAVQTGIRYALNHGYDVAFQYDADGQHRPDQIATLTAPILRGEADLVLGSRFLQKSGYKVGAGRGAIMWLLRTMSSWAIHQRITDNTSGFRAYGRGAMQFMVTNCSCDYPEIEAIILLVRNGYRFTEVPATMGERVAGQSMFTPVRAMYFIIRSLMSVVISVLVRPVCRDVQACKEESVDSLTAADGRHS